MDGGIDNDDVVTLLAVDEVTEVFDMVVAVVPIDGHVQHMHLVCRFVEQSC
jgi:hypothetical protein